MAVPIPKRLSAGGKILGMDELLKRLRGLDVELLGDPGLVAALKKDAIVLKNSIRSRAPRGETGNLKRSLKGDAFKDQNPLNPAAYVTVDRREGAGGRHAHLVEFGHGGPAPAPAHPFFRPAVRAFRRFFFAEKYLKNVLKRFRPRRSSSRGSVSKGFGGSSVRRSAMR